MYREWKKIEFTKRNLGTLINQGITVYTTCFAHTDHPQAFKHSNWNSKYNVYMCARAHTHTHTHTHKHTHKVKWSCYRPGVAQRVGRGIALLFHDRGTRRGWMVSSMPWPHFTPGKDPVPILQEAGWAPGLVWTGAKSRPHWNSILDRPAHSQ